MAAVISTAMAPSCTPSLIGLSRLPLVSSGATPPPPLFTEEEFRALMGGQCELLSSSENDLRSPLLSLQLQAQLLCRDEDHDDIDAQFQEPPPFSLDDFDLEAPISDEDIQQLAPLFCEEDIQELCAAQQLASMQFPGPLSDDQAVRAGKRRVSSPWPSCIEGRDRDDEEAAGPPSPPPPPIKKARTKRASRREDSAARATRLRRQHRLRKWRNKIATRILTRQFRAPELSRDRTALRCQCAELALADGGPGCCALHQDAPTMDRAWMLWAQGHVPLVGGPGEVLVPTMSAGNSKGMVLEYARWRRSVSMPTRFYVQRAVEQALPAPAQQPDPDDDWMMPEY